MEKAMRVKSPLEKQVCHDSKRTGKNHRDKTWDILSKGKKNVQVWK